jgi:chemotaxis protein methyltransferase CheR
MFLTEDKAAAALADPALEGLYRRAGQILGIRPSAEDLAKLKAYLEERCGASRGEDSSFFTELPAQEELAAFARLLTVNETYFFREPVHFSLLARHFLPRLAKLRRPVRVCSAATSSGCEAYSLAMVLDFYSRGRGISGGESEAPFVFEIDAFDVNPDMIEIARQGRYTDNAFREDGSGWKFLSDLYLRREGREYRVSELVREKVKFSTHNIMQGLYGVYDIIFFRNALIYFSRENRKKLFSILTGALREGGIFIAGVSETAAVEHPLLESRQFMDAFYFKKRAQALPVPAEEAPPLPAPGSGFGGTPAGEKFSGETPAAKMFSGEKPLAKKPSTEKPHPAGEPYPPGNPARQHKAPAGKTGRGRALEARVVETLLEGDEDLAAKTLERLREQEAGGEHKPAAAGPSANELAAAVISFLGSENTAAAQGALEALEEKSGCAATAFLRAEYHYHRGELAAAEAKYQEAAGKDKAFWPAFYRLSSLAEQSNQTRYEYKIRKALESIDKGGDLHYEIYIGGFSPDYYRRILEKKAAGENGLSEETRR